MKGRIGCQRSLEVFVCQFHEASVIKRSHAREEAE